MAGYDGPVIKRQRITMEEPQVCDQDFLFNQGFNGNNGGPHHVLMMNVLNPNYPITCDVLNKICTPTGRVLRIIVFKKTGVQALVEFDSVESATRTKEKLTGKDIYSGCCTLQIEYAYNDKLRIVKNDEESWDYTNAGESDRPGLLQQPSANFNTNSNIPLFGNGQMATSNMSSQMTNTLLAPNMGNISGQIPGMMGGPNMGIPGQMSNNIMSQMGSNMSNSPLGMGGPMGPVMGGPMGPGMGDPMGSGMGGSMGPGMGGPMGPGMGGPMGMGGAGSGMGGPMGMGHNMSGGPMGMGPNMGGQMPNNMGHGMAGPMGPNMQGFCDSGGMGGYNPGMGMHGPRDNFYQGFQGYNNQSPNIGYPSGGDYSQYNENSYNSGYGGGRNSPSDVNAGCVLMIYGIDQEVMNCDKLFNLFCLYGNVHRVKFLKSKERCAMVQMGDPEGAQRVLHNLNGVEFFNKQMSLGLSKHLELQDVVAPFDLADGTPSYKEYIGIRNNRFANADAARKNRIQAPSKIVHFFNAPPGISEEEIRNIFEKAEAVPPNSIKCFGSKNEKSSSGILEFNAVLDATEAVIKCNHSMVKLPNGKFPYTFKLCFSNASLRPRDN